MYKRQGYDRSRSALLPAGTVIAGEPVGGMTADQAGARLEEVLVRPLHRSILLRAGTVERSVSPWDLGLRMDVSASVRSAFDGHRSAPLPKRVWDLLTGKGDSVEAGPELDRAVLEESVRAIAAEVDREPQDARLDVSDGWVTVVPAQEGYRLDVAAAIDHLAATVQPDAEPVELPVETLVPAVGTETLSSVVLVRRGERRLYHYVNGEIARAYPVAVGKQGHSTPSGVFEVTAKRRNPTWVNPGSAWARAMPRVIGPGPSNPLGTRAINISSPGIRIHGTAAVSSIGTAASHGCIRMLRSHVEELFEVVEVGNRVVIV